MFLSVLIGCSIFGDSISKLNWEKINTGINEKIIFVSGKTIKNFWIQTKSGKLINIKDRTSKIITVPKYYHFIKTQYFQISENDFFCAATTPDWKGEIYRIKNNVWKKYDNNIMLPLRFFVTTSDKRIYLYGDSGTLLEFRNNKWEIVNTKFESHILTAIAQQKNIFFATRGDGVFVFDGNEFKQLSPQKNNDHIISFVSIDNTVYGYSISDKLYSYKNNIEKQIIDEKIEQYFKPSKIYANFGFEDRIVYVNNKREEISYPRNYNISSTKVLDDGSILLFSFNGNIYISGKERKTDFVDFAPIYRVADLPFSNSKGTLFFNANNDSIIDLLVLNSAFGNFLSLYQGVKNSAFANITSITNLPFKENLISFVTISDFNKDNLNDIIIESKIDSLQKLLLYKNIGDFKFEKISEIVLPSDFQKLGIRNLSTFDYDRDGDDDIIVTSYYGKRDEPGYILIYKNNSWGDFTEVDTSFLQITRRWNEKFVFADITNNDTLDIYNSTSWRSDHLYFGTDSNFVDKSLSHFVVQKKTETTDVLLSDFDNDADLDIITVGRNDFIRLYSNNGKGKFTEITDSLFDSKFLNNAKIISSSNLNTGDFNNDGFTDLIVTLFYSGSQYSTLFLNENGKAFKEVSLNLELNNIIIRNSTIADFDKDGDLDIYCGTNSHNLFLINRLDKHNSIRIKLNGIISSTSALGSKVWVYKRGKLDSINYLIGYKELGTEQISKNRMNDLTLHFGLDTNKYCDVKVKFLSGRTIVNKNVKYGSVLIINELPTISAFFYNIPGSVYRFITNSENQIYFTIIIFSHIILLFGLWYGFSKLHWTPKLTLVFTILDITLFWGSLFVSSFSRSDLIKFFIPVLLTFTITMIPLALFYWINKSSNKSIATYNDKLLELIISFSHGKWALRNLNSIILFCENTPGNWINNKEFQSKLKIRFNTFLDMTSSSINEIIEYEKMVGNVNDELINLATTLNGTVKIVKDNDVINLPLPKLAANFTSIRNNIKVIRSSIYSNYSSKPTKVINNLIANFETILEGNRISVKKVKLYPQEIPVLIKGYELGNIVDNLFQNSIRFMKNLKEGNIIIELYKESPKIILKFSNNGSPIPKEKWETIFEHGYSEGESTGHGLFSSRELLKKYGGRMYVDVSNSEITTFKIELNEGILS